MERALRAEDRFAVTAEAVAVDRGVSDGDFALFAEFVVRVVFRRRIFVQRGDVVVDVAVERVEERTRAGRRNAERTLLFAAVRRRDEDVRRVELVASEFRHQPAAGAVPKAPTDEFFDRRTVVGFFAFRADGRLVTVIFGFAVLNAVQFAAVNEDEVGELRALLLDFLFERGQVFFRDGNFAIEAFPFGEGGVARIRGDFVDAFAVAGDRRLHLVGGGGPVFEFAHQLALLDVDGFRAFRKRHLPAVGTREVAAVPLSANVVQIAEDGRVNEGRRVIVKDVVVALVADREVLFAFVRNANHFLAVRDAMSHQFFGQDVAAGAHRFDRGRSVQVQRQTDDNAFDSELFGVFQEVVVVVVDLNELTRLLFGFPTVFFHQTGTNRRGARAVAVAVEGAVLVVRTNVRDRDDLNVFRVDPADQNAPFVAGSENRDANRFVDRPVFEVVGADSLAGSQVGARRLLQEIATSQLTADRGEEVFLPNFFLFAR